MPQWYGKPGDIQAFGEEILKRIPEPDGSMLYFQIMSTVACYCEGAMKELPHANYPVLRRGYGNITHYYGVSNLNANRFAFMASTFRDQLSARKPSAQSIPWTPKSGTKRAFMKATAPGPKLPRLS